VVSAAADGSVALDINTAPPTESDTAVRRRCRTAVEHDLETPPPWPWIARARRAWTRARVWVCYAGRMSEITLLVQRAAAGDRAAFDAAYEAIHAELKALAARRLDGHPGRTLSATVLVNETWLKLAESEVRAKDRAHFFRIAARAMRQVWIDRRRSRAADRERIRLYVGALPDGVAEPVAPEDWTELVDWDSAMRSLEQTDAELAELVELRVFSGLDLPEIAALKGVTERTVQRHWRSARAFLLQI
jgi:RNA polymerase sigma factor (TIGR02999 family)